MNKNITRRDWLNKSATVLGSSFVASVAGFNPLLGSPKVSTSVNTPIRMMFNENPYGPSQVARKAMRKAFSESNLYSMRYAKSEFKNLMAKLNGVTPDHIAVGFGSGEILKKKPSLAKAGFVYEGHQPFIINSFIKFYVY